MTVPLAAAAALQHRGLAKLRKPERIAQIASRATHTPDACCLLDLRSVCPVFFEFATRVAYISEDDEMFTTVQGILRERLKNLAAILENECLRTSPPLKSHSLNASVSSLYEAMQQHNPARQREDERSTDLEDTSNASRKTFIRGLTLSELQALEVRKQQLLQL